MYSQILIQTDATGLGRVHSIQLQDNTLRAQLTLPEQLYAKEKDLEPYMGVIFRSKLP